MAATMHHEAPVERWTDRSVRAMGSTARVIFGDGPGDLDDWALEQLTLLELTWSRFRPASELNELNAADGRWFPMSPLLAVAVDRAIELHRLTEGIFDPTVHDRLVELGYDRTFREVPASLDQAVAAGRPTPGLQAVERSGDHIRLPAGVRLDLGGVGKGLAADLLATGLLARGATAACVSLGGDVRAAGVTPGTGWAIPVVDPTRPGRTWGTVALRDAAIVTSTTRIRTWERGGRRLHHLIDPRTGDPSAMGVTAAVVTGPEAWLAEGVAKAAIVAGPVAGAALLERTGCGGWIVTDDGRELAVRAPRLEASR